MSEDSKTKRESVNDSGSSACYLDDPVKFEKSIILLYDWAKIWHRQSGGYTASDTACLLMRVEKYIDEMIDRNPDMECFRSR